MKNVINNLKNRKLILTFIAILILISLVLLIGYLKNKPDKPKKELDVVNKISDELYKENDLEGFKFSDIKFEYKDGIFTYMVEVTNTNSESKDFNGVSISLLKNEKEIGNIELYNKTTIEPGESILLKNFSTQDYTKADSLNYSLIE